MMVVHLRRLKLFLFCCACAAVFARPALGSPREDDDANDRGHFSSSREEVSETTRERREELETLAVMSTGAYPSTGTKASAKRNAVNAVSVDDNVWSSYEDSSDVDVDDDEEGEEVTVRGFETKEDVPSDEDEYGWLNGYEWLGVESEEGEEEGTKGDNEEEDEDDFHPTYWEIGVVALDDDDQNVAIELPPLPLLRGKEADEHEMWASFPTVFQSTETHVTYIAPQNDIRPHIAHIIQREILKTLYLGLTLFVLVVFVLDTCFGCVFNDSSPNEFERNFNRNDGYSEEPLYFDTEYKTFREFPPPTKAKQASTQTSTVSGVV
jgi:hypothetical protein